jgi:hypothetical protein
VREFGMTAICNGLGLHGGFIPYNATFLVFSDYARNAVRMSALMPVRNIHVYTHDSIGLGRRRPDPPAGRARGQPAVDSRAAGLAALRHGRVGGGLEMRHREATGRRRR